ncbi:MBL fold metallo-hydrolase [Haloferula sp.]|uniref:MBL fold metallo-hydrolase n=1 Tax=Haloferula sp. TaxID=2497595 RepID=UPI003C74DBCB
MSLYNTVSDVVRKAMIGLGISPDELARRAGITSDELSSLFAENYSNTVVARLAPILDLDASALCRLPEYQPDVSPPDGLIRLSLPFEDEEVNVWLIESEETRLIIDTGSGPGDLLSELEKSRPLTSHLLITHGHRDHIGGAASVAPKMASIHSPAELTGCKPTAADEQFEIGPFSVRTVDLSGHHPRALGYFINGPSIQLFAVGDAIFAGSIGGCPNPAAFQLARKTIEAAVSDRDADLLLLPGHGPITRLGSERKGNPFLAAWNC